MSKLIKRGDEARKARKPASIPGRYRQDHPGPQGPQRGSGQEVRLSLITNDGRDIAKEIELDDPLRTWAPSW